MRLSNSQTLYCPHYMTFITCGPLFYGHSSVHATQGTHMTRSFTWTDLRRRAPDPQILFSQEKLCHARLVRAKGRFGMEKKEKVERPGQRRMFVLQRIDCIAKQSHKANFLNAVCQQKSCHNLGSDHFLQKQHYNAYMLPFALQNSLVIGWIQESAALDNR